MSSARDLADSLSPGAASALHDYLEAQIKVIQDDLEHASLAKIRFLQGKLAGLRELQDVSKAMTGGAQSARRNA